MYSEIFNVRYVYWEWIKEYSKHVQKWTHTKASKFVVRRYMGGRAER